LPAPYKAVSRAITAAAKGLLFAPRLHVDQLKYAALSIRLDSNDVLLLFARLEELSAVSGLSPDSSPSRICSYLVGSGEEFVQFSTVPYFRALLVKRGDFSADHSTPSLEHQLETKVLAINPFSGPTTSHLRPCAARAPDKSANHSFAVALR